MDSPELDFSEQTPEVAEVTDKMFQYRQKVTEGLQNGMTLAQAEELWIQLIADTKEIYSEFSSSIFSEFNEKDEIRKKKLNIEKRGSI